MKFRLIFNYIDKANAAADAAKQTATPSVDSQPPSLPNAAATTTGASSEASATQAPAQTPQGEEPVTANQTTSTPKGKSKSNSPGPLTRFRAFLGNIFKRNPARQQNSNTLPRNSAPAATKATTTETPAVAPETPVAATTETPAAAAATEIPNTSTDAATNPSSTS